LIHRNLLSRARNHRARKQARYQKVYVRHNRCASKTRGDRSRALGSSEREVRFGHLAVETPRYHESGVSQLGRSIMRKLVATIALLAVIDTSVAVAQTVGMGNSSAPPPQSTNPDSRLLPAPVGHRQPRVDQVPDEKDLGDPNDPINRENAALDRMVKGICRGC
jgi:hypothetical protein